MFSKRKKQTPYLRNIYYLPIPKNIFQISEFVDDKNYWTEKKQEAMIVFVYQYCLVSKKIIYEQKKRGKISWYFLLCQLYIYLLHGYYKQILIHTFNLVTIKFFNNTSLIFNYYLKNTLYKKFIQNLKNFILFILSFLNNAFININSTKILFLLFCQIKNSFLIISKPTWLIHKYHYYIQLNTKSFFSNDFSFKKIFSITENRNLEANFEYIHSNCTNPQSTNLISFLLSKR